jgi:hypothetical protein
MTVYLVFSPAKNIAPPEKISILWSKCATAPPKNISQFCTAPFPPGWNFPMGADGAGARGARAGAGARAGGTGAGGR